MSINFMHYLTETRNTLLLSLLLEREGREEEEFQLEFSGHNGPRVCVWETIILILRDC